MKKDLSFMIIGMVVFGFLGSIHFFEPAEAGEEFEFLVNARNRGPVDIDDASVRVFFMDMGEMVVSSEFDLDEFESNGFRLSLDIPSDVTRGYHLVKVVVSNDEMHNSKFFEINVR